MTYIERIPSQATSNSSSGFWLPKMERFGGRPKCLFPRASSNLKRFRRNYFVAKILMYKMLRVAVVYSLLRQRKTYKTRNRSIIGNLPLLTELIASCYVTGLAGLYLNTFEGGHTVRIHR